LITVRFLEQRMNHDHSHQTFEPKAFWRTRYAIGLLVLGAIAAYFLLSFLLQWPTLLTLVMFPFLLVMYVRLAITEDEEMRKRFGAEYEAYAARTPRFLPSFRKKTPAV
jgi:steroid 5-alpha reductase family enzyme